MEKTISRTEIPENTMCEGEKMRKYNEMTQEDFDRILMVLVNQNTASYLLNIPGVYELVAEDYNNMVLEYWEQEQEKP